MRVVDLADEFGLTTAETLDLCARAGVAATGGGDEVTEAEAAAIRQVRQPASAPAPPPSASGAGAWPPPASPPEGPARPPVPSAPGPFDRSPPDATKGVRSGAGSHLAVFGVTASLFGLCVPIVPAVIGIALGTIAKRRARAAGNAAKVSGTATAAQVLGVLFLVGWLVGLGWSYRSQRTTVTLSDKTEVEVRKVPIADVQPTDCLVIQSQYSVEEAWVIDCAEPHDAQIVTITELPYVDDEREKEVAELQCIADAQRLVPADRDLTASVIFTTAGSRTGEDPSAICIIESADRRPLVGRL